MVIIPAIDIKDGKCVRLRRGEMDTVMVYAEDPVAVALRWQGEGAEWLHVVDLDGAIQGKVVHTELLREICRQVAIPVQVGGGLRRLPDIDCLFEQGISRAVLGTMACEDPGLLAEICHAFPQKIFVALDARHGRVATRGWTAQTTMPAQDVARRCEDLGVDGVVYTDILRDGTESGVDVDAVRTVAQSVTIPVIASGGVASLEDVRRLAELEREGVMAAIIGRALYTGAIKLPHAISVARRVTL